jgi:hypothetical protein
MRANVHDIRSENGGQRSDLEPCHLNESAQGPRLTSRIHVRGLEQLNAPAPSLEAPNDFVHVRVACLSLPGCLQADVDKPHPPRLPVRGGVRPGPLRSTRSVG